MIITFKTRGGSIYHIDHLNRQFVQQTPKERIGPLWNTPSVVVGKRVEIFTAPEEGCAQPIRLIQTGIVVSREVLLESTLPKPEVLPGNVT